MTDDRRHWLCFTLVLATYSVSLLLPADCVTPSLGVRWLFGFPLRIVELLRSGQSVESGFFFEFLGWSLNITVLLSILMLALRRYRLAAAAGLVSATGACIWFMDFESLSLGFYVWLYSMVLVAIAGGALAFANRHGLPEGRRTWTDPSVFVPFNRSRSLQPFSREVQPDAPPDIQPSSIQPPSSPPS
jgi:hypothetical protein